MDIDTTEYKILTPAPGIDGFKCGVCGRLFSYLLALEKHEKQHPRSDRRYRCAQCPYSTKDRSHLRDHLLTHSGERPHRCETCGKGCITKSHLKRHLLIHTEEKPFICSTCGKGFNVKSSLRRHERTHTGERRYRCLTCGRDFCHSSSLTHSSAHTLPKPYRRPHCQYMPTQLVHLQSHIGSKHTTDIKYNCSFCGKEFFTPSELQSHILMQYSSDTI